MLHLLVKKLKSEKSSLSAKDNLHILNNTQETLSLESKVNLSNLETSASYAKTSELPLLPKLKQQSIIAGPVSLIRYAIIHQLPSISAALLACPISHFHHLPSSRRNVKEIDLQHSPFPPYLNCLQQFLNQQLPTYNHLLINVYPPGIGIMPHLDGPLYRNKVVVVSLGGPAIIAFTKGYGAAEKVCRLFLQDKSIHIFERQAYQQYLHGIEDYRYDSIFLRIDNKSPTNTQNYSISNYPQSRLSQILVKVIPQLGQLDDCIDLSNIYGSECTLLRIKDNEQYNWKVQLGRKQRISITIREKLKDCF